jgi:zinc transport system substrate-binding protein
VAAGLSSVKYRVIAALTVVLAVWAVACAADQTQPLRVVASIHPLALMAKTVGGEDVVVTSLVQPGVTPHDFAFRMSHRRQLQQADLVIWVGPSLEPYLQGPLAGKSQLAMESLDVAKPLVSHTQSHHDQHLWLSRQLALVTLQQLAEQLADLNPAQAQEYRARAAEERERLQALQRPQIGTTEERPYASAHPAFDHLLHEFDLPEPLILSASPEIGPSARRLWQVSQQLQAGDCLLVEWPAPRPWQQQLARKYGYRTPVIDIMGYQEGVSHYSQILEKLLQQLGACLSPQ